MQKHFWRLFPVLSLLAAACVCPVQAASLKELRGEHFLVFFEQDETYAREVLHQAERLYAVIMRNLGHDQLRRPWLGERRCKITIFKDQEGFRAKTKGIVWAEGMANYQTREIFAFNGNPQLISNVLPHEMAHLMFREFIGFTRNIPLWLEEGVALAQEPDRREQLYPIIQKAMEDKTFLAFDQMAKIKEAKELSTEKAGIFYAESLAAVNFLVDTFHREKFLKFFGLLRDGMNVETALKQEYGTDRVGTLQELEQQVRKSLQN